ncbi:unnamed protein product [Closterium sp. NIES-53]
MVNPIANVGVADTLEARLDDVRKRHADGEYGTIPLLIVELGIRSQWATERPSRPVSPRPVRNEGGVDDEVDGGARVSGNNGAKQRGVIKVDGGVDRSQARVQQSTAAAGSLQPQPEVAGLKGFADGTVPIPSVDDVGLRGEFCAAHLLTFMVISRCCSPVVQLALRSCREQLDAGHQAWHFILSMYQVRDDLYITQLEEKTTHIRMGKQESATDYCNRARRILAEMRMAGAEYSTASYISHIAKGPPRGYNLMKRMMMVPGTHESLDEDSITSYILQDEAMQEAEQPIELLPQCPDRDDKDEDDTKEIRGRSTSRRPRRDAKPRKEKKTSKKTSLTKDVDNSSGKSQGDGEASCSMVGVAEPTVSLAPEAGEDFQAVAAAVQANPMALLLASGCSHHLMGTKAVFVDMEPSDGVKHRVLIPDVLYVPGIQANLLSAGQLKESEVQLQGDGDEMLPVAVTEEVLGRARYNGQVLCTDLRPCSMRSSPTEMVALWTIVSATMSTPDRLHARLAHVSVDTIKSSAKHKVATGLDITPSTEADPPCVSCVGGKLARQTFPDKGSDAAEALAVVHIDLCGPFQVAAKDGSLFFLLLKDRHTRFVWVMPVAKKSDVLWEFQKWLVQVEWQAKKSVPMLRSDRGGEFLGKEFTDFNGMAEREMRMAVESVRTMLLHMGVQHHWWHLALRQAVWVRNCLEWSTTPSGTTPYQLLTEKKPDLMLARVWGCMVPEQQRGGKLAPKARLGLHLGVSPESKGWEVLDLTDNKMVTSVKVIFYETLSLEVWTAKFGPASGRTQAHPPADTSMATVPLLAKVNEPVDEDAVEDGKPSMTGERQTGEPVEQEAAAGVQSIGELPKSAGDEQLVKGSKQLVDDLTVDEEGELSAGEDSTDSDMVEVPITKPELRRTGRARRLPERLSFHACLPRAAFIAEYNEVDDDLLYDDAKEDEELSKLDPDMHADPEHCWDIATMTVQEVLASWKGEAVKAAMEEEIHSLVGMGTWEMVELPCGVNIMKNCYVTLRIFLSIIAVLDLNLMQLDMKNSFLQSKLDRVLYMDQPDYFDDGTGRVCKLRKSLYGLNWKKSQVDEALYFKASDNGLTCWVLVYIDDLLAASSSPAMLKELKELLDDAFELREISPVVKYLGLEIVRDRPARKLWLHQQSYADKLRRRFIDEEQGGRVPKTPVSVDAYAELTFNNEEAQQREEEEYWQKVGSLQFAATTTRPDIAFACSKLGSGLTARSDQHWREVDRCLAYLADTHDNAFEFGGGPESLELIGYVDADGAGDKQKRTSTSGYVFIYGGAAVFWSSSRIKCVTLSSTVLEYVAATNAGKEGRRLRFLLAEFKLLNAGKPTILRVDNKSAIMVAAGLGLMGNLKHMERRYAWLQHMVRRRKFVLKYIPTTEQPKNFLTKALHFPAFNRCSVAIGQVRLADVGDGDDDVQHEVLAPPSLGQRRRLGRMYGSGSRPSTVGELLDRLRRAAGDRCGVAVDQGAQQLQLTGVDDGWAVDQEGQFDREVDGAVRRPEK